MSKGCSWGRVPGWKGRSTLLPNLTGKVNTSTQFNRKGQHSCPIQQDSDEFLRTRNNPTGSRVSGLVCRGYTLSASPMLVQYPSPTMPGRGWNASHGLLVERPVPKGGQHVLDQTCVSDSMVYAHLVASWTEILLVTGCASTLAVCYHFQVFP